MKKIWCIVLVGILGVVSLMSGCSSSTEENDSGALKVAFVSPVVDSEAAETYAQTLTQRDASINGKTIDYAQVDEEGNEISERTAAVGLNVSTEEDLTEFMNSDEIGIYIVGNAPHVDQAKALLLSYVTE